MYAIVSIKDKEDKTVRLAGPRSEGELAKLLDHYDKKRYNIEDIKRINGVIEGIDAFCYKDSNLELGI